VVDENDNLRMKRGDEEVGQNERNIMVVTTEVG
jgi:hypothetical protein